MRKLVTLTLCILSIIASAQKSGKPETYAKTITATDLRRQLYIVAGPEMEGRETATEGQRKAAAYIENEFKRIGLQSGANGSYQQPFPIYQDSLVDASLEVNGKKFELNTDFNVSINSLNATMRFSEAVFIAAGANADSIQQMNLAGKLVLLQSGAGTTYQSLQNRGIAAVLMISPAYPRTTRAIVKTQLLHGFRERMSPQQFTISPEVAQAILHMHPDSAKRSAEIKKSKANVLLDVKKETTTLQSTNVVGVLPGTDLKEEYLFITAHYDHIGKRDTIINYGADDDGSGTVSVIELAEAFAQAKKRDNGPRRSIVFMTVSGEEKGL